MHSPYLFELVRMVICDANPYYCWQDIENRRRKMLRENKTIRIEDFGTGKSGERRVREVAKQSLESRRVAETLFRIVAFLNHQAERPLRIWELGTSLGITTAYLAEVDSRNRVITFEGSHEILQEAKKNWKKLGIENIEAVEGNLDDTLYIYIKEQGARTLDFVYMDANHTYEATMRYWQALLPLAHEKTIFALDDIHHSPEMEQAWEAIKADEKVSSTIDFFHFGLAFVDPHYIKRHYKMRL